MMKAIAIENDKLVWMDVPRPHLQAHEVLIRTVATAINRADLVQRSGAYAPPPGASTILGLECSGVIEQVGADVDPARKGESVCALLSGGGYAELVAVPATHTLPVPKGMTLETAAAVPEVFATAWLNLRLEGQLQSAQRVLVHAGASGVGTACIQLCKAWGNPVYATVGSADKVKFCLDLGATGACNYKDGPWAAAAKEWGGVDVILDPVGGSYLEANIQAMNARGRLVNIGLMGGREGNLPMGALLMKRLTVRGSVLRSRSIEEKNEILQGLQREVWPLLEAGTVRPILETVIPIEEAERAHALVASNQTVGKVILRVPLMNGKG